MFDLQHNWARPRKRLLLQVAENPTRAAPQPQAPPLYSRSLAMSLNKSSWSTSPKVQSRK